jgi:hypothetical protein
MIDQFTRDLAALIIVVGGLSVMILEFQAFRRCKLSYRWIFIFKAGAGLLSALLFITALLRGFTGGTDIVDPSFGRPVFVILLTALALGAIHQRSSNAGGC